ncbi:DUF5068 domain-containing protein [Listeria sp. PSOL-1]|uniref:DUF5068 domain-containing protein n=1 Tax=Listeria sp. PSOL-1 TaxID=1844999 RepID=UPI0013D0BAC3|nr:DUF5068 domain-containing protein [Listeria sp. PSOL-1]
MKKVSLVSLLLLLSLFAVACGNKSEDKSKSSSESTPKESQKNEQNSNKDSDESKKEEQKSSTDNSQEEQKQADSKNNKTNDSADANQTNEDNKAAKQKAATSFSLSTEGFKVSNLLPVVGGTVRTAYLNSTPALKKDFGNLVFEINQYKVEHVKNATKQVPQTTPESYLAKREGYLVTIDLTVKNKTSKNIMYKPDMINIKSATQSAGGSMDNFVPSAFHLSGSKDPYQFLAGKSTRGLVTYMLDVPKYNALKKETKIVLPNPNSIDSNSPKSTDSKDAVLNFKIS